MKLRRVLLVLAAAVAVGAAAFAVLRWQADPPPGISLRPGAAQVVERGAQVYRTHCAACHGAQLQGQPNWRERDEKGFLPAPPHDGSGHTWHHPDEVLVRIMKEGVGQVAGIRNYQTAMPVYEGVLSDADIIAVLSWIKAQWPREIRARHDRIDAEHRKARASEGAR